MLQAFAHIYLFSWIIELWPGSRDQTIALVFGFHATITVFGFHATSSFTVRSMLLHAVSLQFVAARDSVGHCEL